MDKCNLCGSLLHISGTSKKFFDTDDPTKAKVVLYQYQTCVNDKSIANDSNPCPNCGKQVDAIEHEEIIEKG